nr:nucleotidyltransferase domain-containing protein [Candidatus Sigynarchaeota archaeon]
MNDLEKTTQGEPGDIFNRMLDEAKADSNIIGLMLGGSRGKGLITRYSDYDVLIVVVDGKADEYKRMYPRNKHHGMELSVQSLSQFRVEAEWGTPDASGRYDFAWVTAQIDKTSEIQPLIDEKGRIPGDKVKKFIEDNLGAYINQYYRSLKCFRDGYILGARLEASLEIEFLLSVLFALHDRRLKPFYKYFVWELETHPLRKVPFSTSAFIDKISTIASDANIDTQREIFLMVEKLCRDEGYGYCIDVWDDEPGQPELTFMRTFNRDKWDPSMHPLKASVPLLEYDPSREAVIEPRLATERVDIESIV